MMRARVVFVLLVVLSAWAPPATAQWHIGLQLATTYYRGTARDTSGNPHARPGDATMVGLRLDRPIGRLRGELRVSYARPGLSLTGQGLTILDRSNGQLLESATCISFQVGGIGPSGAVRVELGPALHLWKVGDEIRTRVGALGGLNYEWSVARRWTGGVTVEATLSKSWFDAGDLPPEFERRVTWRYGVGLGLRYRLSGG